MSSLMDIYLDPKNPGGLGGVQRFYEQVRDRVPNKAKAQELLEELDPYTVNKPRRRRFRRNRMIVTNLAQQYQADLADMRRFSKTNKGINYLLIVIDCFSRKAAVVALKDKTGVTLRRALGEVFDQLGIPDKLQTDKGTEFKNKTVQNFLKDRNVVYFTSENEDVKCAMLERFIRTLKTRMWRMFRLQVSTSYLNKLPDLVDSYNNSVHRAHGLTPNEVTQHNSLAVYHRLYPNNVTVVKPRFVVGDWVRMAKNKSVLEKGYDAPFTEELFEICQIVTDPVPTYKLKDELGNCIKGKFYESELSIMRNHAEKKHQIDKVLQRKGNKVKVRWLGYEPAHDSWIDKECVNGRHFT